MNFFKRYLFKKALLEDELANEERRKREIVIEKQPEPVVIEPKAESKLPTAGLTGEFWLETLSEFLMTCLHHSDLELLNYEISEEEQSKLLEEYEKEIKERSKTDDLDVPEELQEIPKPATKSKNQQGKSTNVQSRGKNNKTIKTKQQDKQTNQQQAQPKKGNEKKGKSGSEQMKIEKDHFKKENESTTSDESWEKDFEM